MKRAWLVATVLILERNARATECVTMAYERFDLILQSRTIDGVPESVSPEQPTVFMYGGTSYLQLGADSFTRVTVVSAGCPIMPPTDGAPCKYAFPVENACAYPSRGPDCLAVCGGGRFLPVACK